MLPPNAEINLSPQGQGVASPHLSNLGALACVLSDVVRPGNSLLVLVRG
jgi:hypothetical protein